MLRSLVLARRGAVAGVYVSLPSQGCRLVTLCAQQNSCTACCSSFAGLCTHPAPQPHMPRRQAPIVQTDAACFRFNAEICQRGANRMLSTAQQPSNEASKRCCSHGCPGASASAAASAVAAPNAVATAPPPLLLHALQRSRPVHHRHHCMSEASLLG